MQPNRVVPGGRIVVRPRMRRIEVWPQTVDDGWESHGRGAFISGRAYATHQGKQCDGQDWLFWGSVRMRRLLGWLGR